MIIDTHCHIDMYKNPIEILKENESLNIKTIAVTNLPSHFEMGFPHLSKAKKVRLALGFHPLLAREFNKEFSIFQRNIDKTSYIGEIGLDYSKEGGDTKDIQLLYLNKILSIESIKNKIISLHSRQAEQSVLECLLNNNIKNAIFHWYSGNLKTLDKILSAGYFCSINTAMIKSKSGQQIIDKIPKSRILTESDGPYIKEKNKIVKSADLKAISIFLSEQWNESIENVEKQISSNFNVLINRIKKKV